MELEQYGLTRQAILDGEYAEFDAVEKPRREKRPMYLAEVVDQVTQDTFTDLRNSYHDNDDLTAENAKLKTAVETAQAETTKIKGDLAARESDDAKLKQTEDLFKTMKTQFDEYRQRQAEAAKQIETLKGQLAQAPSADAMDKLKDRVDELETADEERNRNYQSLASDVNAVLDKLEEKFADLPEE